MLQMLYYVCTYHSLNSHEAALPFAGFVWAGNGIAYSWTWHFFHVQCHTSTCIYVYLCMYVCPCRLMMPTCLWPLAMPPGRLEWPWWASTPVLGERRSFLSRLLTFSTTRRRGSTYRLVIVTVWISSAQVYVFSHCKYDNVIVWTPLTVWTPV